MGIISRSQNRTRNIALFALTIFLGLFLLHFSTQTWLVSSTEKANTTAFQHHESMSASINKEGDRITLRSKYSKDKGGTHDDPTSLSERDSGFKGPHLFHVTSNGTLVEGVIYIKFVSEGTFPFTANDPNWESEAESAAKTFKFRKGRCYWCPRKRSVNANDTDGCLFGTFHSGWYKDDHLGRPPLKTYNKEALFKLRSFTKMEDALWSKREFTSTYFRCTMIGPPIPVGVEGVLRVENMPQMVFYVNPQKRPVLHKDSSVVCFRGMFGTGLSIHSMAQVIQHYLRNLNITYIVLQETGLLRGLVAKDLARHPIVHSLMEQGRFVVVDLRDGLQTLYGPLASDIIQFSGHQGQIQNIGDCVLRAKVEGIEWVLVIDRDEVLFPGSETLERASRIDTWAEIVRQVEQEALKQGKALHVIALDQYGGNESYICDDCDGFDTNKLMAWVTNYESNSSTFHVMRGFKSAVRLSPFSRYPLVNTIGIHTVAKSGSFPNGEKTPSFTINLDYRKYHLRHYSCLNSGPNKCDTIVPLAYAPMDDWPLA